MTVTNIIVSSGKQSFTLIALQNNFPLTLKSLDCLIKGLHNFPCVCIVCRLTFYIFMCIYGQLSEAKIKLAQTSIEL